MELKINDKTIGTSDLYIIIEEGQANQGDISVAKKMIDLAEKVGADAIEFQLFLADDFYIKDHSGYEIYKKNEFTLEQIDSLIKYSHEAGLDFIAAPLSHNLIPPLVKFGCNAFNVNASDINNPTIIDSVCLSGLPFFISLPLANEEEITWVTKRIEKHNVSNYTYLHGQHTMASGEDGVMPEHTSLGYINALKQKYDKPIGFIDHTPYAWMPSCIVASGANIITKHLIESRKSKGPDWHVCLEPNEMKNAISWAKDVHKSINQTDKVLAPGENFDIALMRRSVIAQRPILKGQVITSDDIEFKRPGTGIPPNNNNQVINKTANRDIEKDEIIQLQDLK